MPVVIVGGREGGGEAVVVVPGVGGGEDRGGGGEDRGGGGEDRGGGGESRDGGGGEMGVLPPPEHVLAWVPGLHQMFGPEATAPAFSSLVDWILSTRKSR